jgi:hypothetical protein
MSYRVRFVPDAEMPPGHDYVLIEDAADCVVYFRASFRYLSPAGMADVLERSWAGLRGLDEVHRVVPTQGACAGSERVLDNVTLSRMLAEIV